ncbi:non-ribosomal peptide synthetase [Anabaena sp. CA = ATCC 33047]|uniref:non-ribosomal peptide synthetase n=1 Tax=Anabaena sp. (strain CA / ATCC 33047) TaxID=52271 RepID=UPI0008333424|nr:non-ribosomal peptide synthetase [Anabaena sp. CA = ATCC 33047]
MQNTNIETLPETVEGYQLSPQQTYIWQLQEQDKNQHYRVQMSVIIDGNLNREVFKLAVEKVVNRHEILRTNFKNVPGLTLPLQIINPKNSSYYQELNLSQLDLPTQQAKCKELFQESKNINFNFAQDSLLNTYILTLSSHQHLLLISLPAICGDVKSLQNLVSEIKSLYTDNLASSEITEEPLQYVDIATWQQELLTSSDSELGKNYWQQQDISAGINLKLPWQKQPIPSQEYQPGILSQKINSSLVEKIKLFGDKFTTPLDNLFFACWLILVSRLTSESELIIGTAFDGRPYQELESAMGLLAKYLPITIELDNQQTIINLIEQIAANKEEAKQWQQYYNWEQINKFDNLAVGFDYQEIKLQPSNQNINWLIDKIESYLDKFNLRLSCIENQGNWQLNFYYNSNLFSSVNIASVAAQFETLLANVISEPDTAISKLNILPEKDYQQLIYEFNNTQTEFPQNKLIHQLFEQQVKINPDNIAVVYEDKQLTYKELNARTNQIAHYLQQNGVVPESIVAICLERSLEAIISILAVLKAGGAYLPLDPNFPTQSLLTRLEDAQAQILLTNSAIQQQHPTLTAPVVINLDTNQAEISNHNSENPNIQITEENLAYIIYTSGSTGQPKGVAIEHRQILNYLYSIQQRLNLPKIASFALVSTLAADLGNTSIFPALCSGGCLHLISNERATNGEALADYFRQKPIDCLKIVPAHLEALLTSEFAADLLPKVRLILGGEACSWELIKKIQSLNPECIIINHYGPTETTVGVLTYQVEQIDTNSQTVPLGKPLANTQVYVLDAQLQPVPIGVPGELYISGAGVARGYLNHPEITNEKFIQHTFHDSISQRLYKTGDLVRYHADGNLEFLGRIDNQVKIRGFRIELGEIEVELSQHPDIQQAVVIVNADEYNNQKLVAYVVPENHSQLTSNQLRDFLKETLPEYMIPSVYVFLKALPLTANGKIARQSLPAPEQVKPELAATYVPPKTEIEKTLAEIWAEVLRLEKVGIHDNFFDLGGHSLLLTQVTSRLYNALGVELSLRQIFATPTIAELVVLVAEKQIEQTDSQLLEQILAELEILPDSEISNI